MEWLPMKPEPPVTRTVLIAALPFVYAPQIMRQRGRDRLTPTRFPELRTLVWCHMAKRRCSGPPPASSNSENFYRDYSRRLLGSLHEPRRPAQSGDLELREV